MGTWKGKVSCEDFTMIATVYYQPPTSTKLGEWHGEGISNYDLETRQYETNIGTILVDRVKIQGDKSLCHFIGSGKPNFGE
jgi:hypothetical protein